MKKDDLISDDFLKQFKTHEELTGFLKQIQKRGIEKMLEGELDGHLDYDKHQKSTGENVRNGHAKKKIKTSFGESEISVPRDREASFNPMIVPKRGNMVDGIENVIVSLYAKGMSNSDIEEQIHEVYGFNVSASQRVISFSSPSLIKGDTTPSQLGEDLKTSLGWIIERDSLVKETISEQLFPNKV